MEKQYPRSRNREYGATQRVEGNKVQFEEGTLNQEGAKNISKIVLTLGIFLNSDTQNSYCTLFTFMVRMYSMMII